MPISKELKQAILELPTQEKDKLLLKVLTKDKLVIEQLTFQLLEFESSITERRDVIQARIQYLISKFNIRSAGMLMMEARSLNALITHHVKITKDTFGEVSLTLELLNTLFLYHYELLFAYSNNKDTMASYLAKKTEFLLKKVQKLHPDYWIEFEAEINILLGRIHNSCATRYAKELNIPKNFIV